MRWIWCSPGGPAPTLPNCGQSQDCASRAKCADSELPALYSGCAGVCLPVALRRLRTAGARSHAMRRARDRLRALSKRRRAMPRSMPTHRANWRARCRSSRRVPNSRPHRASVPWRARENSPGNGPPCLPGRSTRRREPALDHKLTWKQPLLTVAARSRDNREKGVRRDRQAKPPAPPTRRLSAMVGQAVSPPCRCTRILYSF